MSQQSADELKHGSSHHSGSQHSEEKEVVVAILDAGAQYGKVIDRRVREMKVKTEVLPLSAKASTLAKYSAIIISGGPQSVYGKDAVRNTYTHA